LRENLSGFWSRTDETNRLVYVVDDGLF
jgi:toxin YoeB